MKIRKAIKYTLAGVVVAAPMVAMAGAPGAGFGQYTRDGAGNITNTGLDASNCSSTGVSEADFMQERCSIGGETYIHTIQDSGPGAEVFKDESWVKMGSAAGGIASKASLTEVSGGETFTNEAILNTGDFYDDVGITAGYGQGRINLSQGVTDGPDFNNTFDFIEGTGNVTLDGNDATWTDMILTNDVVDTSGTYTGTFKLRNVNVEVDTASAGQTASAQAMADANNGRAIDVVGNLLDTGASITQLFSLNERQGAYVLDSGTAAGTVSWQAGETIIDLEIGQTVGGAGVFGLHDFTNESDPAQGGVGVDSFTTADTQSLQSPSYDTNTNDPFAPF
jgi:uncharacterized Zn ribbon protein